MREGGRRAWLSSLQQQHPKVSPERKRLERGDGSLQDSLGQILAVLCSTSPCRAVRVSACTHVACL